MYCHNASSLLIQNVIYILNINFSFEKIILYVGVLISLWPFLIHLLVFFYVVPEAIGTATTLGLLCQPRVIVKMIV
jgi:hypothetical protein